MAEVPKWLRIALQNPEIPSFLFYFSFGFFNPAQQSFIYQRICQYNYGSTNDENICAHIDTAPELKDEEALVQDSFSRYSIYMQVAALLPTIFVATIYGSWCDDFSHRLPMAIAHLGGLLTTLIYLLVSLLPIDAINPEYVGLATLFQGLGGQSVSVITVALSHAAQTSPPTWLLIRFGIIETCITIGEMTGYLFSAFVFNGGKDYFSCFVVQMAINCYAIFYSFTMLPDLHKDKKMSDFCSLQSPWKRLKDGLIMVVKRPEHRTKEKHKQMLVALILFGCATGFTGGTSLTQVIYAFLTLDPISFTPFQYSIYQAVFMGFISFGLLAILPLLRSSLLPRIFPLSEATIGLLSLFSKISAHLVLGLGGFFPTFSPWIFCVVNGMATFVYVTLRSALSKLTEPSEHGQIFAISGLLQASFGMLASVAYNYFYGFIVVSSPGVTSLNIFIHGYIFIFVALLCTFLTIIFSWLGSQKIENWSFKS